MSVADHEIEDDRPEEEPCTGIECGCACVACRAAWAEFFTERNYQDRKDGHER